MPKQITLRFIFLTLLRLKHVTKIEPNGPQTLADVLVKNRWGRPSQLRAATGAVFVGDGRADERTDGWQAPVPCMLDAAA
jgi:hypothetical protein